MDRFFRPIFQTKLTCGKSTTKRSWILQPLVFHILFPRVNVLCFVRETSHHDPLCLFQDMMNEIATLFHGLRDDKKVGFIKILGKSDSL